MKRREKSTQTVRLQTKKKRLKYGFQIIFGQRAEISFQQNSRRKKHKFNGLVFYFLFFFLSKWHILSRKADTKTLIPITKLWHLIWKSLIVNVAAVANDMNIQKSMWTGKKKLQALLHRFISWTHSVQGYWHCCRMLFKQNKKRKRKKHTHRIKNFPKKPATSNQKHHPLFSNEFR